MRINETHVTETEAHRFATEASTLWGRANNSWPTKIATTLGNGRDFSATYVGRHDGEIQYVDYSQLNGCIHVRVFND